MLFHMFFWCCHEAVFYVVVRAFHRYYLFCLWRQKRLVTVSSLECPLLTSSEMYLLQIKAWCSVSCQEIPFRMLLYVCIVVERFLIETWSLPFEYYFHAFLVRRSRLSSAFILLCFQSSRLVSSGMTCWME